MNYRHIYHAGSFTDVFKHVILCILLNNLQKKGKPFCYIDSHAGLGIYDLSAAEVSRSPEYQQGIAQLITLPALSDEIANYVKIVNSFQKDNLLLTYPGSPLIAAHFLGEHDKLILNELHPEDFIKLKKNMKQYHRAHCHQRDAYEFLPAILPPTPKRGLILIDPPYEKTSEYDDIIDVLKKSLKRFENGIYMLWYPIVNDAHTKLVNKIKTTVKQPIIHAEMISQHSKTRLRGSGVIIINPPWNIENKIICVTEKLKKLL